MQENLSNWRPGLGSGDSCIHVKRVFDVVEWTRVHDFGCMNQNLRSRSERAILRECEEIRQIGDQGFVMAAHKDAPNAFLTRWSELGERELRKRVLSHYCILTEIALHHCKQWTDHGQLGSNSPAGTNHDAAKLRIRRERGFSCQEEKAGFRAHKREYLHRSSCNRER